MGFVNEVIEQIWSDRYRKNNESPTENLKRVAKYCAKSEKEEAQFFNVMSRRLFLPAGRTMSNSGIGIDLTLNNCFTSPMIRDDMSDIFNKVALGARTHQKGGGIGYDFSQLRPKNSPTSNDAVASGPISFMDVFNAQTATILQGNRRGANMGVLNVYHMDIEEFINAKSYEHEKLNHFNISVMIDDEFIEAVRNNKTVFLHHPVYDDNGKTLKDKTKWKYQKEISAKYLWDLIIQKAYDNGEPGVFFYDNLNNDNNLWYTESIVNSNPCGEYLAGTIYGNNPQTGEPLNPNEYGGACNLGSLFLHNFVLNPFTRKAKIDYQLLEETIHTAVRFLDNIIDINSFPDKIYENYQKSFRTIGLGVTGLANMLVMLNLKYNSEEARDMVDGLMNFVALHAYKSSVHLAREKEEFPYLDREKFVKSGYITKHCRNNSAWQQVRNDILKYGIRNSKILSVAPTGTLSLAYGNNCSSGIEPIFSLSYDRKVKMGGQSEEDAKIVKMKDYGYHLWENTKDNNIVEKDVFVTAMDMSVDDHVKMLAKIAYHVDMSVSKTINVPTEYSFKDTQNIYMKAWRLGVKGCTIFRPNEIRKGILISPAENNDVNGESFSIAPLGRGDIILVNDDVVGKKRKLITGCGSLHCTAFFDPESGDLLETYFSKGSSGGCQNFMIGLSRMISLSARAGVDINSIVDQLNSCGVCPSYAVRSATKRDTSKGACCPIAVGNALIDMWKETQNDLGLSAEYTHKPEPRDETRSNESSPACPECGDNVVFEGGCNICKSCGWSRCS